MEKLMTDNQIIETKYDDPIWEYTLATRLKPYIPSVRYFWDHYAELDIKSTGVTPLKYPELNTPDGLMLRMTSTPVRSPIKNVQAFPFVPIPFLNLARLAGGTYKMVEFLCDKGFEIDEFKLIEKHGLPVMYHRAAFVAFIPKQVIAGLDDLGKYVYLTRQELCQLSIGGLPQTVVAKCARYKNID